MLKLQPSPTFAARVKISVPGADATEIEIVYRHKTRDELRQYFESAQGRKDDDLVAEIVAGWSGVDAEFSLQNLSLLLQNYPAAAGEIVAAYAEALLKARLGN